MSIIGKNSLLRERLLMSKMVLIGEGIIDLADLLGITKQAVGRRWKSWSWSPGIVSVIKTHYSLTDEETILIFGNIGEDVNKMRKYREITRDEIIKNRCAYKNRCIYAYEKYQGKENENWHDGEKHFFETEDTAICFAKHDWDTENFGKWFAFVIKTTIEYSDDDSDDFEIDDENIYEFVWNSTDETYDRIAERILDEIQRCDRFVVSKCKNIEKIAVDVEDLTKNAVGEYVSITCYDDFKNRNNVFETRLNHESKKLETILIVNNVAIEILKAFDGFELLPDEFDLKHENNRRNLLISEVLKKIEIITE